MSNDEPQHEVPGADEPLVPLPPQPDGVPWPTADWPTGPVPDGVDLEALVERLVTDEATYGTTYAVVVVQGGRLLLERYGGALPHWDGPDEPVSVDTPLLSWSMAKSMVHITTGILVAEGRLDPVAPAPVPSWQAPGDGRGAITLDHLLTMRDGLGWAEDYVDGQTSDVIHMLFGEGAADVAGYATARPLAHEPGTHFTYSSGTSNIVARIAGDAVADLTGDRGAEAMAAFLHDRLFGPIGMTTARPRFDDAGTWVASSYVYATARDMARFGLLALRGGTWDGRQVVPAAWIDHGRTPRSVDPDDGWIHGAHWWVVGDDLGSFWANGYEGQAILCVPALDLVVVRLGRSPATASGPLRRWRADVVDAFRGTERPINR